MIFDGEVANPLPSRGKDCVAESGRRRRNARFAHSSRCSFAGHNIYKDVFGRLAHFGDVEGIEIRLHGAPFLEGQFPEDGVRTSHDGCALNLCQHSVGNDDRPGVDRTPNSIDAEFSIAADRDFHDMAGVTQERSAARDAQATPFWQRLMPRPIGVLRGPPHDVFQTAHIVGVVFGVRAAI